LPVRVEEYKLGDTVIVYDTLHYDDTIAIQQQSSNTGMNLSIDVFTGNNTSFFNYKHDNAGFEDSLNAFSLASSGYQAGIRINLKFSKIELTTGFEYHQLVEDFAYDLTTVENNPLYYWQYFEVDPLHEIDTITWQFVFNPVDSSYVSIPVINCLIFG